MFHPITIVYQNVGRLSQGRKNGKGVPRKIITLK
jgi:hypothetical protein